MTHVLRAHGLFPTAADAVGRIPQNDGLQKALDGGACLTADQRRGLVAACTLRKAALNVVNPGAGAQRVMDDCDKIIELIG